VTDGTPGNCIGGGYITHTSRRGKRFDLHLRVSIGPQCRAPGGGERKSEERGSGGRRVQAGAKVTRRTFTPDPPSVGGFARLANRGYILRLPSSEFFTRARRALSFGELQRSTNFTETEIRDLTKRPHERSAHSRCMRSHAHCIVSGSPCSGGERCDMCACGRGRERERERGEFTRSRNAVEAGGRRRSQLILRWQTVRLSQRRFCSSPK